MPDRFIQKKFYSTTMYLGQLIFFSSVLLTLIEGVLARPQQPNGTLGATYFITNKNKNSIIVSSINKDGTLSFAREVPTGGAGGSASGGADALLARIASSRLVE